MGRTADSYLREQGVTPIENLYPFVEMSEQRLEKELGDTWTEQMAFRHSPERTEQIARKIRHLMFELNCRLKEGLEDGR